MKILINAKCYFVFVALVLCMASCISSQNSQISPATFIPVPVTSTPETQATLLSTETPYPAPLPTSTLPPPLPTLELTKPPVGLLFTSFTTSSDHIFHQILPDGHISQITTVDERDALLSNNQRFIAFVKYVPADLQPSSYLPQLWIRDRWEQIENQIRPPAECDIEGYMFNWSPDDSRLYYFVSCGYDRDLWYVDVNTWGTVNLTANANRIEFCFYFLGDTQCSFYPNLPERMLVASEPIITPEPAGQMHIPHWDSTWRLTEVDANTGKYIVLDEDTELFELPSISPDGNVIAYDRGHLLYEDGTIEKLPIPDFGFQTLPQDVDLVNPSWSPDGKTIAWDAAHIDGWNLTALMFYDVPSRTFREILRFQPYYFNISICVCETWYKRPSAWSPDGKYFAYTTFEFPDHSTSTNSNMFLEGYATLRVFDGQGNVKFSMKGVDEKLVWNPDGEWLAFQASERDIHSMHIYTLHVDDWKAYKVDLPFESVRLKGWGSSQSQ